MQIKIAQPTPIKPTTPSTEGEIILDEQQDNQEQQERSEEEQQQVEEQADSVVPKTQQNHEAKPDIDKLTTMQFNDDMWRIMRGGLPCLETSADCLQKLQEKAVGQSLLLKEIDNRIQEANQKIEEAKSRNQRSIKLSILTPALQYMLGPTSTSTEAKTPGLLDNIAAIFRGDLGIINGLLRVIGVPLFQGTQGGNAEAQTRAITISDISVKVAELQRSRAQLAETIREKVAQALVKFDEARTDYQTSQVVAARAVQQFQVYSMRYVSGNSDTESYLAKLNSLDRTKSQTYAAWAKMRRALFEIKLLVLNVKDAEI
ncbi:hypothetical protein ICL16_38960 [Iningainema sp. BLCCT55]|uniref:Outer membrane efflux protein n=1 Tax=Iningainema tapete BLCC-T55 TaxID=2748662 RepID=A0A8J6Y1W0_9CYAN|nr:hypothetical protein [Iningainema tapete BLCC-T55]